MIGKIKPLMLLNVVLAIGLVSALLFATATYAGAPMKTVYVTHSTFEAAGKVVVQPDEDEIIHFDTKGYKEVILRLYRGASMPAESIIVFISFYVQETEYIGGLEYFFLIQEEPKYLNFSVMGSSLDIRFAAFKVINPVEVSWCLYLTT